MSSSSSSSSSSSNFNSMSLSLRMGLFKHDNKFSGFISCTREYFWSPTRTDRL